METKELRIFFDLINSAVFEEKISEETKEGFLESMLPSFYNLAKKHDLAHLIGYAISSNGFELKNDYSDKLKKLNIMAVMRYEQLKYELNNLSNSLEKNKIPFIPLKGSVIRNYYKYPYMRTSCDIDVLIHEEDKEKAVECLINECGYKKEGEGSHDVSLFTEGGRHIELHFDLVEKDYANNANSILKTVWEDVKLKKGCSYLYEMSDEFFYLYHIAHMAKHFENGGCGIRPFIDIKVLNSIPHDKAKREELLKKAELLTFAKAAENLSKAWFDKEEYDELSLKMQSYILTGGVYGTNTNRITVQQQKQGGKIKYALNKIFLPYDIIKFHYPVLKKHKWLMPLMQIRRWCKLIFLGGMKRSVNELKINSHVTDKSKAEINIMLNQLEIK